MSVQWRVVAMSGVLLATSCYKTTVYSGLPPAPGPSVEYDAKWHSGVVYGIAEISGPYDLDEICPGGWAEISTETSFLNGFVEFLTWSIYTPQSVTIVCSPTSAPQEGTGEGEEVSPQPE